MWAECRSFPVNKRQRYAREIHNEPANIIGFYHDKGGLTTSKKDLLDAIKENICGKVTRELVPGSIEVYPIAGFGAVEIGLHR